MFDPNYAQNGFLGRVTGFLETANPLALAFVLAAVMVLLVLALFGRRYSLMAVLIVATVFSGAMWAWVDNGSTVVRWLLLGLLAINAIRIKSSPGLPILIFACYVILGFALIVFSEVFLWSLQTGGLLLVTVLAGIALADYAEDRQKLAQILKLYLVGAFFWAGMALVTLPDLMAANSGSGRFSGAIVSAPLFVNTGGIMLPLVLLMGLSKRGWGWIRYLAWPLAFSMVCLLLLSGQRTGTYAGILGCLPLLARRKVTALGFALLTCFVLCSAVFYLATTNPKHLEFLIARYTSADTTGRTEIWEGAIHECMKAPLVGHGHGADRELAMKMHHPTHNTFISAWYNTGVVGVALFVAAFAAGGWQTWKVLRGQVDDQMKDIAAAFMGVLVAEFAVGMFETNSSPSNFATITLILILGLIGRMTQIVRDEATRTPQLYRWMFIYPNGRSASVGVRVKPSL